MLRFKAEIKIILILGVLFLAGCGSGPGNNGDGGGGRSGLNITCMDVNTAGDLICNATAAADKLSMASAGEISAAALGFSNAVYDAGRLELNTAALGLINVTNEDAAEFSGILIAPLFVNGCGGLGFIDTPAEIPAGKTKTFQYGGALCAGAQPGPNSYEARLYSCPGPMAPTWNNLFNGSLYDNTWDWDIVTLDMGCPPLTAGRVDFIYNTP